MLIWYSNRNVERLCNDQKLANKTLGKAEISRDLASKLEFVLGIEAFFWLKLENEYRDALKKVTPPNISTSEEAIARSIPYSELAKQGGGWTN